MRAIWPGLCLLLPLTGMTKDHPTAECSWLFERIEILEKAIKQGDELGTREEIAGGALPPFRRQARLPQ